jgi:hypothetical protein
MSIARIAIITMYVGSTYWCCSRLTREFFFFSFFFQVIEAKTAQPVLGVEGEDARVDAR